jgi:DNA-directed RNA polymerase specialized sigma subunit
MTKQIDSELVAQGMVLAERFSRSFKGLADDVYGACCEAVVLAARDYNSSLGVPFSAYCYQRIKVYGLREAKKMTSVVSTNYDRRKTIKKDDSIFVEMEDGTEEMRPFTDDRLDAEAVCEARESLSRSYDALMGVVATLPQSQRAIARDLITERLLSDDESLSAIAERHGVSRQTAYKVEAKLKDAMA